MADDILNNDGATDDNDGGAEDQNILNNDGGADDQNVDDKNKDAAGADDKAGEGGADDQNKDENQDAKDGDQKDDDNRDNESKAPENYEAFKMPEGIEQDEDLFGDFVALAKESDLSQEEAQKFVDMYFAMGEKAVAKNQAAAANQHNAWHDEVKADETLGGENFDNTMKHVALVRDNVKEFGKVYELLGEWGVANHPDFVRAFASLGKLFAEDKFASGAESQDKPKGAKALYPTMN